jgi:hypothetical protein
MFGNPYNVYNPQASLDRINNQIAELEKMKTQIPMQQPTNLTQNFQIAPTNNVIKHAESMEEVQKNMVIGDTPFFSNDMSIVWIKSTNGEIKSYELKEIIQKDEKDIQIEYLQAQIEELKKEVKKDESNTDVNESTSNTTQE